MGEEVDFWRGFALGIAIANLTYLAVNLILIWFYKE